VTDRPLARSAGVSAATAPSPRAHGDPADAGSFDALYRATADDLYAYVATLVRDRAAAEDVVAAAFERAYRRQRSYDARRGSRRQWLFGIARHAALDELRRRKRVATLTIDPPETAEDVAELAARRQAVLSALGSLSARERELIALRYYAGLSNTELAAVVGVSTTNAGTLVHRAMTKLREAVDD